MLNPALIAIAAMMESRRRLVRRLREEGATAPERARPLSAEEVRLLGEVIRDGIVREAEPGAYYVDEAKYADSIDPRHKREQVRQAFVALVVAVLVLALVALGVALLT